MLDQVGAGQRGLAGVAAQVADGDGAGGELVVADDDRERAPERSAAFIWAFIEPAPLAGERSIGRDAGPAQLEASGRGLTSPPVTSTTNTSTPRRGRREHALRVAASAGPARCPVPKPMPGVGGPPSDSTRPS